MAGMNESGRVDFWMNHPDADWATNDQEYNQPAVIINGVSFAAAKRADKKLEVRVFGPYSKNFWFVNDLPACGPRGLWIQVWWSDNRVTLALNGYDIDSQDKDDPLGYTGDAFSSKTDEASRAVELAFAFDVCANSLVGMMIASGPSIERIPSIAIPVVVCNAFSMELYLKALHRMDYNKKAKTHHELDKLFAALKPATQKRIRDAYDHWLASRDQASIKVSEGLSFAFDDVLRDCASAFEKWRYMYELRGTTGMIQFTGWGLKEAIKAVAREVWPQAFEPLPLPPPPASPSH